MVKNWSGAGWRYRGCLIRRFYDSGRGKVIAMKLIRIGLDRQAEVQAIKHARASTKVVTRKSGSDGCARRVGSRVRCETRSSPPSSPSPLWNPLLMEYNELVLINGVLRLRVTLRHVTNPGDFRFRA